MRTGNASGLGIVFLSFAVILLAVPVSDLIATALRSTPAEADFIGRFLPFALGIVVFVSFPRLRARMVAYLSRPIPAMRRIEVVGIAISKVFMGFGFMGGLALWYWLTQGSEVLDQAMRPMPRDVSFAQALSATGILMHVLLAALVGPVVEELLFRGFLFDAWSERWGAFAATVFTSTLFAAYHPHFLASFTSGAILVCVVRRTGTLWGSIVVHSIYNLMLWYPLAGQFGMPDPERAIGDISTWGFNLACLLFAAIALPIYIWIAVRHPYKSAEPA